MALILNIDTATGQASICLSENGRCLSLLSNPRQKDHASWLHPAILTIMEERARSLRELDAVGVTAGPGSYTGLRVGLATAKGLCYSLDIPMIAVNTLEVMARAVLSGEADYLCPMIDARRMEVFTAVYDRRMVPVLPPCAIVLDDRSFSAFLAEKKVCFFGDGHHKFQRILHHPNARFSDIGFDASTLSRITYEKFGIFEFSPLVGTEPLYLKDYFLPISK